MLMYKLPYPLWIVTGALFCPVSLCSAALTQKTESVNVNISGTIVNRPSCTISDSATVEVSFGNSIGVNTIDGMTNRKVIPYTIACDDNTDSLQLVLKITGTSVDFDADNATVRTSEQSDLGVKIYQNNIPFALNSNVNINIDNMPTLEAVLVKRDGKDILEGEFNAYATLHAEYQ